ncbi:MAG: DNA primase [bacterium]|nr:DNA primase [bacterium]
MARIPEEVVDQIREGIPIETVVGEFVPLRRAGSTFKGLCPFHDEKTPSFTVNPRMGIFKCFGCGAGGNVFQFLMRHEGMEFLEAIKHLAQRQGIDLSRYEDASGQAAPSGAREKTLAINRFATRFYWEMLRGKEGERARAYLAERGVSDAARDTFGLGYAPARWDALLAAGREKGFSPEELALAGLAARREDGSGYYDRFRDRIIFPIQTAEKEVLAFGGRSLPDSDSRHATAKYINSPDSPAFRKGRVLYGFRQAREAIREGKRALVTEGYFDVISLWQAGYRATVAPLGTALTAEHIRMLRAHAEEIVFVFDPDRAGEAASDRAGGIAGRMLGLSGAPDSLVAGDVLRKDFIDRDGLGAVQLRVVDLPEGQDVDDFLRKAGPAAFGDLLAGAEGLLDHTVRTALGNVGSGSGQAEKMEALERLVPVLSACHRSVRDQYFSVLEVRLGIPYPTVDGMVQRLLAEEARRPAPRGEVADLLGEVPEIPRLERDIMRTLIARPGLAARPEVSADIFSGSLLKGIFEKLRAAAAEEKSLDAAALLDRLKDPNARALVIDLAAEAAEEESRDFYERMWEELFDDLLKKMEKKLLRQREESILKKEKEARQLGGEDSLDARRLWEEKYALLQERRKGMPLR